MIQSVFGFLFLVLGICLALAPVAQEPGATPAAQQVRDISGHLVVLSVDDCYHSVFTNAYPLLKKHRMPATLGVICDYVGSGKPSYLPSGRFMNRSEIQELVDSCKAEVASHSISHPYLTRLDSASAWREIAGSKRILESLFGTPVITFVYPYGDVNGRIVSMVGKAGYGLARAVRPGNPNLWVEPYRLPTIELRREITLPQIQQQIERRRATILLLHQIVPEPEVFTQWSLADFAVLLDWLNQRKVRVVTLAQLYREWWLEKLSGILEDVAKAFPDRRKGLLFEDVDIDATETPHPR